MKLRGLAHLCAAAAASVLLVGAFSAPASAQEEEPVYVLQFDEDGMLAADFTTKGCEGINGGSPVAGKDGWLFDNPKQDAKDYAYVFGFITGTDEEDFAILALTEDGVFSFNPSTEEADAPEEADALKDDAVIAEVLPEVSGETAPDTSASEPAPDTSTSQAAPVTSTSQEAVAEEDPLTAPPAGVKGALSSTGGWLQTPAGWSLVIGFLYTNPAPTAEGEFHLVRTCPAPAGGGGAMLPITGTNIWLISGTGGMLVLAGGALFMLRRRRESVKFVA